jgi:hypothetical protein
MTKLESISRTDWRIPFSWFSFRVIHRTPLSTTGLRSDWKKCCLIYFNFVHGLVKWNLPSCLPAHLSQTLPLCLSNSSKPTLPGFWVSKCSRSFHFVNLRKLYSHCHNLQNLDDNLYM